MYSKDKHEAIISEAYSTIVSRVPQNNRCPKAYNCASTRTIVQNLQLVLSECETVNLTPIDTTVKLIEKFLQKDFFVYDNVKMSVFIGYSYLKQVGVVMNGFSTGTIHRNSTSVDIQNLVVTW